MIHARRDMRLLAPLLVVALLGGLAAGCGGQRRSAGSPITTPAAPASIQSLYESGRDAEVIAAVAAMAPGTVRPDELWFVAQSHLRLGHRDEATMQFSMLRDTAGPGAFAAAVEIALALMNGSAETIDSARNAAAAFPTDPYVQYELGVAHAARNDFPAAARAFDTCVDAAPRFAYAYYQAGLMYDRLNRADLTVARFESFLRVAPQAPERPQVESILQTVRR